MPINDLPTVLQIVLDAVEQPVFVDDLRVRVVFIGGLFADVVFADYIVDREVMEGSFLG